MRHVISMHFITLLLTKFSYSGSPCSHDTCIIKKRHVSAWLGTKLGTSSSPSGLEPENQHPIDVSELGTCPHPVAMTQTLLNSALQQPVNSVPSELTDDCRTRSSI